MRTVSGRPGTPLPAGTPSPARAFGTPPSAGTPLPARVRGALLEVLRDPDHRRALAVRELDVLEARAGDPRARQLHRGAHLREESSAAALLQALHHGLDDHEAHPREPLQLLVAVNAALQVHLAQRLEPGPLRDVDEVPDLHRVAGEEGDRLQQAAAPRVLAREWLDEAREVRVEQVDEGPRDKFGDAAPAALPQDPVLH